MNDFARIDESKAGDEFRIGEFTEATWHELVNKIASAFSFGRNRLDKMSTNSVLKLVAGIPYLANCDEPERIALAHMGTFILAGQDATRSAFAHSFRDSADLERRLDTISHFSDGNSRIIRWGMKLLTIAMINDHIHDRNADQADGKMNPVNAGHWVGEILIANLKEEIGDICDDRLNIFMSDVETQGYWQI